MRNRSYFAIIAPLAVVWLSAPRCNKSDATKEEIEVKKDFLTFVQSIQFDKPLVQVYLKELTKQEHPFGSERQKELANYLAAELEKQNWLVKKQKFRADVPNPDILKESNSNTSASLSIQKDGTNVFTRLSTTATIEPQCVILFGSHYDTKRLEGNSYHGANDSGSSSAALFWILRTLQKYSASTKMRCDIAAVWFDGEEAYLNNWSDGETIHPLRQQDNTYGSRYFVSQLDSCQNSKKKCLPKDWGGGAIEALILLDLIGSKNARLTLDSNSTKELNTLAQVLDKKMSTAASDSLFQGSNSMPISDDHLPFLKAGIDAIDLIDFQNLDHWHKPSDTLEKISFDSIEKISRLSIALALSLDAKPIK